MSKATPDKTSGVAFFICILIKIFTLHCTYYILSAMLQSRIWIQMYGSTQKNKENTSTIMIVISSKQ